MYRTWEELYSECKACQKCELCKTRTNVVVGVGNPNADIMFIGEGPRERGLTRRTFRQSRQTA